MRIVKFTADELVPKLNLSQPIELAGVRRSGITLTSRVLAGMIHSYEEAQAGVIVPLLLVDDESEATSVVEFVTRVNISELTANHRSLIGGKRVDCANVTDYEGLIKLLDAYPVNETLVLGLSLATIGCTSTELVNLRTYLAERPAWRAVLGLHQSGGWARDKTRNDITVYHVHTGRSDVGLHILTINNKGAQLCTGFDRKLNSSKVLDITPAATLELTKVLMIDEEKVRVNV